MGLRTELHSRLCAIPGVAAAYFQPPESIKLNYPCIVYELAKIDISHAGNCPYLRHKAYTVTVIDRNPDSTIPDAVASFPMVSFERHFVTDNLHHFIFRLYY